MNKNMKVLMSNPRKMHRSLLDMLKAALVPCYIENKNSLGFMDNLMTKSIMLLSDE